jgi:ketosteroid isomerase-like protein
VWTRGAAGVTGRRGDRARALDRWGKGDPNGYLEIMANDVTYFDPMQDKRVDGIEAMKQMLAPLTGKIAVSRFDMIDPKVQRQGDSALAHVQSGELCHLAGREGARDRALEFE